VDGNPFPSTLRSYVSSTTFNFSYKFSSETLNHKCGRRGAKVWTARGQVCTDCYSSTNFQAKPSKHQHLGVGGNPFPSTLRSYVSSRIFNFSYKFSSETLNHRCGRRRAKVWTTRGQVWTDCYSSTNFQAKPSKHQHLGVDGIGRR